MWTRSTSIRRSHSARRCRRHLPSDLAQEKYQYNFLERIELVAHIQNAVEDVFGEQGQDVVGRAMSAATFTPPILDPLDTQRFPTNKRLEENRDRLLQENYVAVDQDDAELWRISVRLGALNDVDYGQFVSELKRVVEPVLTAYELRDVILRSIAENRGEADADSVERLEQLPRRHPRFSRPALGGSGCQTG